MTLPDILQAQWTLQFDTDGTEDIAVIFDADGEELTCSRPFWLSAKDDQQPPTLAAMLAIRAVPTLLAALLQAQRALNTAPRFRVGETDSYAIARLVDKALQEAEEEQS